MELENPKLQSQILAWSPGFPFSFIKRSLFLFPSPAFSLLQWVSMLGLKWGHKVA